MKPRLTVLLVLAAVLVGLCAVEASAASKKKKPCVATLATCPEQGCGGDAELNKLKNRADPATSPEKWTLSEIIDLEEEIEPGWGSLEDRAPIKEVGEGTPVVVTGYLVHARASGPESCNCYLTGQENNDIHMNLAVHKSDDREESVVAEITPRVRAEQPGWTVSKLTTLATRGAYVRMSGWLLLDTQHISRSGGPRATVWEVHPVTRCEVCTKTKKECDQGKAGAWKALESYQP